MKCNKKIKNAVAIMIKIKLNSNILNILIIFYFINKIILIIFNNKYNKKYLY